MAAANVGVASSAREPDYYRPPVQISPDWANPAVVGLMGFGLTTVLAGLGNLGSPYNHFSAGPVGAMAMAFGGSAQFIAGLIAMRKGEIFPGSAFMGYGSFWWAYVFLLFIDPKLLSGTGLTADFYSIAAFTGVWALFTLTFLINAPKHGVGITLVFLFLFIAFLLLTWQFWMAATGSPLNSWETSLVGGEIVFDGLVAWFVATGILTNANYGRRVIPI